MSVKKIIYIVVGCICVGLGAIGAFIPILPTVPFLLVSAFCFARSSDKLNNWFKSTKLYKNNLESYVRGEGMTIKTKVKIMTTVTILMAIGEVCMMKVPVGQICLGVVWLLHVIAFVFFIKTKKEVKKEQVEVENSKEEVQEEPLKK